MYSASKTENKHRAFFVCEMQSPYCIMPITTTNASVHFRLLSPGLYHYLWPHSSSAPPQYMHMGSMAPAQPQFDPLYTSNIPSMMDMAPDIPLHKNEDEDEDDEDYDS